MKTLKTGAASGEEKTVTATLPTMKFDLNTFDRVRTLTAENEDRVRNDKFLQAVFSQDSVANTCSCDNFILEAHYKVYFK